MKNGKQAMVLFSLSVAGMNQGLLIQNRQNRAQRSGEALGATPGTGAGEGEGDGGSRKGDAAEEAKCCRCKPIDADTIDIYARAVFPAAFAAVNVIYWVAYTM